MYNYEQVLKINEHQFDSIALDPFGSTRTKFNLETFHMINLYYVIGSLLLREHLFVTYRL